MDVESLQNDLYTVDDWCRTWGMRLNVEKCKVRHFGKSNPKALYSMTDDFDNKRDIENTNLGRNLGVVVANVLKWSEDVDRMLGKANRILDMLKRKFESRDLRTRKDFFVSLLWPHLEYEVQAWNPHLKYEIEKIERVQRRANRISISFEKLGYEERLKR